MAWTGFFGRLTQPTNPRTVALMQGRPLPAPNYLTPYEPTYAERLGQAAQRGLERVGIPRRTANTLGNRVTSGVGFTPVVGDVTGAQESGRMIGEGVRQKNYVKAGIGAGTGILGMLPFMPSLAGSLGSKADDVARLVGYHGSPNDIEKFNTMRGRWMAPAFFAVDEGSPAALDYAKTYGEKLYKADVDPLHIMDTRNPEHKKLFMEQIDKWNPWGAENWWKNEKKYGELPGWGDDRVFEAARDAGFKGLLVQERPNLKSMAIFDPEIINFEKMAK